MQEGKTLKSDSTVVQTLQRLIENKKVQLVAALILMLLAIRLYFPAQGTPDAQLVSGNTATTSQTTTALSILEYQESLSKELESLLSQIQGAGKVNVMLTLASSNDVHVAVNMQQTSRTTEEKDTTGVTKVTKEETHSSQPVMSRNTSGDSVVKLKELMPQISGVVVVASGAKDSRIQASLASAVQTILSLPAHRVRVFPGN